MNSLLRIVTTFVLVSTAAQQSYCKYDVDNTVSQPPSAKANQRLFYIGGRTQRVRIFSANEKVVAEQFENLGDNGTVSQGAKVFKDLVRLGEGVFSPIGAVSRGPTNIGLGEFADNKENNFAGLIINPRATLCAADLLRQVERVGDKHYNIFDKWKIDEINLFLYFTDVASDDNYELQISPVAQIPDDPALNIQIPFVLNSTRCHLSSDKELEEALIEASEI